MSRRFSTVVLLFALSVISLAGADGLPAQASSGQQNDWENPQVTRVNTEKPAALLLSMVPGEDLSGEGSSPFISLNGKWIFHCRVQIRERTKK